MFIEGIISRRTEFNFYILFISQSSPTEIYRKILLTALCDYFFHSKGLIVRVRCIILTSCMYYIILENRDRYNFAEFKCG